MSKHKVDILGVRVDSLTMKEAVKRIRAFIEERKPVLVATANAEMLMRTTYDHELPLLSFPMVRARFGRHTISDI